MGLAKQIALPHEYPPERFPSFPALERTAVMSFNQPSTVSVPAVGTKMAVFRQAAYPCWVNAEKSATTQFYSVNYSAGLQQANNAPSGSEMLVLMSVISNWSVTTKAATNLAVGFTGGPTTMANSYGYPVLGVDAACGPIPFTWIPANGTASFVTYATTASSRSDQIEYEVWTSPGETRIESPSPVGTLGNTGAYIPITLPTSGQSGFWIRPRTIGCILPSNTTMPPQYATLTYSFGGQSYAGSTTTAGTISLTTSGTLYPFLPIAAPVEFGNSQLPWYSCRTTAVGMLATNVTQVVNKGGSVMAGRIAPTIMSAFDVQQSYLAQLHPAEKAFLSLETGAYTYCPPSTDLVSFWDYTLPTAFGALPAAPVFRLDNDSLVNVLFYNNPGTVETLAINVDWHIEFRTTSALFDIGLSTITLETLHQAQISLAMAGYFFENPTHVTIIERVVEAAKKYAPMLMGLVSPALGAAAELLLDKRPQTVQPTSLGTSGLLQVSPANAKRRRRRLARERRLQGQTIRPAAPKAVASQQPKMRSGLDMYLQSKTKM